MYLHIYFIVYSRYSGYIYAGIREMKMQIEQDSRYICRVMRTSIGIVT